MTTDPARTLGLLLVAALLFAGCGTSAPRYDGPRYAKYVAIGDSYAAAPYVPPMDIAEGCLRSDSNYPSLVAEAIGAKLRDVTCTGANTDNVLDTPKHTFLSMQVPPQIDAVNAGTDLITVEIGFNDHHLFGRVATYCRSLRTFCPLAERSAQLMTYVRDLQTPLVRILTALRTQAPHARILLVSYPKIAPEHGTCADLPRLRPQDLATLNAVNLGVRDQMKTAAARTGVQFVDFYSASIGHDICSPVPWVRGIHTDRSIADAMHPLPLGQVEQARLVEKSLELPTSQ